MNNNQQLNEQITFQVYSDRIIFEVLLNPVEVDNGLPAVTRIFPIRQQHKLVALYQILTNQIQDRLIIDDLIISIDEQGNLVLRIGSIRGNYGYRWSIDLSEEQWDELIRQVANLIGSQYE